MAAIDTLNLAREARATGDIERCEVLSAAAIHEATTEHEYETAYHAAACLGRAFMSRGEPDLALGTFRHALDIALTHGLGIWIGSANHDLALAQREVGNYRGWKDRAALAFGMYRDIDPGHPGITGLIADMAQAEADRHPEDRGKQSFALQAWRAVPSSMETPHYRVCAASMQMLTAARIRIRTRYDCGLDALQRYVAEMPDTEHLALNLVSAAQAASIIGDFETSASLAERAEGIAEGRGEAKPAAMAREAKAAAQRERVAVLVA